MMLHHHRFIVAAIVVALAVMINTHNIALVVEAACTVSGSCSGHATSVSQNTDGSCSCVCSNQWSGSDCSQCASKYDTSKDCGACASGRRNYPECIVSSCNNQDACSGHAVSDPQITSPCTCVCRNAWTSSNCGTCPTGVDVSADCGACLSGYSGYPSCSPKCTVTKNCNGHATSVTGVESTGCTCTCRNKWEGSSCNTCPNYFDPARDCLSSCLPGYSGTNCQTRVCDVTKDCSGHATAVSGSPGSCSCSCSSQFSGSDCSTCSAKYDQTSCASCASGYDSSTYPNCYKLCTVASDCNGALHATSVSGNANSGCTCVCKNKWADSKCNTCPAPYSGSSCSQCLPGYTGYPNCGLPCSVVGNCSSHASAVIGNSQTGCTCSCRNEWTGAKCEICDARYDSGASADCGKCASGYDQSSYPSCYKTCTNAANCNGRASYVGGNVGSSGSSCQCNCRNRWRGSDCSTCDTSKFNITIDPTKPGSIGCDRCITGYSGYPYCAPACTVKANCNNHATSVSGTTPSCSCTCRNSWSGSNCGSCDASKYDSSKDCGACIAGFSGYPNCNRVCNVTLDCSGHATSVSGYKLSGCTCFCRNKWTGSDCSTCPAKYAANADCAQCNTPTYGGTYPNCLAQCTTAADCNGRATNVTGLRPSCSCTCKDQWTGTTCNSCPSIYHQSTCNKCAAGRGLYPTCAPFCTIAADCNGHATAIGGVRPNCTCVCSDKWTGSSCGSCDSKYDQTTCNKCATGRVDFPRCALACNAQVACNGHGTVSGDMERGCVCSCTSTTGWTGSTCSYCPTNRFYDRTTCTRCISGYGGFPNCSPLCTISSNCSNHATAVSGTYSSGCSCTCRNKWAGSACGSCSTVYNASSKDCGACADGYGGYPSCSRLCTVSLNCNNRATSVTGYVTSGCSCKCSGGYTGSSCQTCGANWDSTKSCSVCISGYHVSSTDPKKCVRTCSLTTDCSGHALAVSGDGTVAGCTCTCKNQWKGTKCDTCPVQYDSSSSTTGGESCNKCAAGYVGTYPACYEACNITTHCSGHASSVSGNTLQGCTCSCSDSWTGATCSDCPWVYKQQGGNCKECISGYTNYPNCQRTCSISGDCSNHAKSVSGVKSATSNCSCACSGSFFGADCSKCPPEMDPATCAECKAGYAGTYPICYLPCTISGDCSGHATAVTGKKGSCSCTCSGKFTGSKCDVCDSKFDQTTCTTCAAGYDASSYPNCYKACSVAADCDGNTQSVANVSGNSNTGCKCACKGSWTGTQCSSCAPLYQQPTCAVCASPYTVYSYPKCWRLCTSKLDCSNHASSVSGETQSASKGPECSCTCRNSWSGDRCEQCPANIDATRDCGQCKPGYESYPDCYRTCTLTKDCNNHASAVSGNSNTGCTCTCSNQWTGSQCQTCPFGFDATSSSCGACASGFTGYPKCTRECTLADCDNHATEVSGYTFDGCQCSCRNYWNSAGSGGSQSNNKLCFNCPVQYAPSNDCGTCNTGFSGVPPNCWRPCNLYLDCSDHATSVSGDWTSCKCVCRNRWAGGKCQTCAWPLDPSKDCGSCLPNFNQGGYPTCGAECSVSRNCSGHAHSTFRNGKSCYCSCRNQWYGSDCSSCPATADVSNDCRPVGETPAPPTPAPTPVPPPPPTPAPPTPAPPTPAPPTPAPPTPAPPTPAPPVPTTTATTAAPPPTTTTTRQQGNGCMSLTSESSCSNPPASLPCSWNSNTEKCVFDCSKLSSSSAATTTCESSSACTWSSALGSCRPNCDAATSDASCDGVSGCTWSVTTSKCVVEAASTTASTTTTTATTSTTQAPVASTSTTQAPVASTSTPTTSTSATTTTTTTATPSSTNAPTTATPSTTTTTTATTTVAPPTTTTSATAPSTTAPSPSATCTTQSAGCSSGASGVHFNDSTKICSCVCRSKWNGARCGSCDGYVYNASDDCNSCNGENGFVEVRTSVAAQIFAPQSHDNIDVPICVCERHLEIVLNFDVPSASSNASSSSSSSSSSPSASSVRSATLKDFDALIAASDCNVTKPSALATSSSSGMVRQEEVYSITEHETTDGKKYYSIRIDVIVLPSFFAATTTAQQQQKCTNVVQTAECIKKAVRNDCSLFPKTAAALLLPRATGETSKNSNNCSFSPVLVPPSISKYAPCNGTEQGQVCNATTLIDNNNLNVFSTAAAAPHSDNDGGDDDASSLSIGAIIGIVAGAAACLILVIAAIIRRKRMGLGIHRTADMSHFDPARKNKQFMLKTSDSDFTQQSRPMFVDADGYTPSALFRGGGNNDGSSGGGGGGSSSYSPTEMEYVPQETTTGTAAGKKAADASSAATATAAATAAAVSDEDYRAFMEMYDAERARKDSVLDTEEAEGEEDANAQQQQGNRTRLDSMLDKTTDDDDASKPRKDSLFGTQSGQSDGAGAGAGAGTKQRGLSLFDDEDGAGAGTKQRGLSLLDSSTQDLSISSFFTPAAAAAAASSAAAAPVSKSVVPRGKDTTGADALYEDTTTTASEKQGGDKKGNRRKRGVTFSNI